MLTTLTVRALYTSWPELWALFNHNTRIKIVSKNLVHFSKMLLFPEDQYRALSSSDSCHHNSPPTAPPELLVLNDFIFRSSSHLLLCPPRHTDKENNSESFSKNNLSREILSDNDHQAGLDWDSYLREDLYQTFLQKRCWMSVFYLVIIHL